MTVVVVSVEQGVKKATRFFKSNNHTVAILTDAI